MKLDAKKTVLTAMLAALCCVATMIIKIPSPYKGYVNLGDCIVLIIGWLLIPTYGFLAAGIGSSLADVFSGYAIYAPATFVIKGLMAVVAHYAYAVLSKRLNNSLSKIISGALSEILMVLGYFLFEGILYGFAPSAVNIPANAVQGIVCLIIGVLIVKIFEKAKFNYK